MPRLAKSLTRAARPLVVAAVLAGPATAGGWPGADCGCDAVACDGGCDSLGGGVCDDNGGFLGRIATHPSNPVFRTLDTVAGGLQRVVDMTGGRNRRPTPATIRRVSTTSTGFSQPLPAVPVPQALRWQPIPKLQTLPMSDLPKPTIPAPPTPPDNPWGDMQEIPTPTPTRTSRMTDPFVDDTSALPVDTDVLPAAYEDYFR